MRTPAITLALWMVVTGCDDVTPGTGGAAASSGSTMKGSTSVGSTGATTGSASDASSSGTGVTLPTAEACANPPCVNVVNACPFPLWIHGAANGGPTLSPDNAKVDAGGVLQLDLPGAWPAARINAHWMDPASASSDPNAFDKVELTFVNGVMNYNITYVDYLALPARMEAIGPECAKTPTFDPRVSCDVPVGDVLTGCPNGLLDDKRCLSAGAFCSIGANQSAPYCHALDQAIAQCAMQHPSTCGVAAQLGNSTVDAYRCSGYFDSQPPNCSPASTTCHAEGNKWCAALNRGMLSAPDSTDTSQFYSAAPFNTYSKWVHDTCPGIYAFAYDDYPAGAGESGFRACKADRLDVTFCPGG